MAIKVTVTEWTIPNGNDCQFQDGKPCPLLRNYEYAGAAYCVIEKDTILEPATRKQTWKKTPLCLTRT